MSEEHSKLKKLIDWVNLDGSSAPIEEAELLEDDSDFSPEVSALEDLLIEEDQNARTEAYEDSNEFDYPDEIIASDDTEDSSNSTGKPFGKTPQSANTSEHLSPIETLHLSKKEKAQMKRFRAFYLILSTVIAINLIAVLLLAVHFLPEYGAANSPAVGEVYLRYVEQGLYDTGALNLVAAVLFSYRSFDTLGEAFVLFTAAVGVIVMVYNPKDNSEKDGKDDNNNGKAA